MSDGRYSFSLTTFSPTGKLLQIEYALKAVAAGRLSLGIRAKNGVVIATDAKRSSILVDENSIEKIKNVNKSIGCVYSGITADSRVLVTKARKSAAAYYRVYHEMQPCHQNVKEIANVMQEFTQSGGVRPFGVSVLVAGYDDDGPQLYQVDPSGTYFAWRASAIGKDYQNAKTFLEKRYNEEMELEDAIHTALLTLREGFEGEMTADSIEVGIIGDDRVFRTLSQAEISDYLAEAE